MTENDLLLLRRFADTGDAEAFSELVGLYQHFVYAACLRVLGNADDAEDVAQECFLRLTRQAGAVRSSVAGWLHRKATTMSIDEKRRQTARKRREEVHVQMDSSNGQDPIWQEAAPHVDQALNELPDELRLVLVEHFLRRRKQVELAKELGISKATMSRRVNEGIGELRKKLEKAGVIVSAAVLASLLWQNAASAAPATLTATLGKIALAGKLEASAAASTQAASWVGKGTVAGAMTTAAKVKIAAVVVAALAVGGVVAREMVDEPEEPARRQAEGAHAADFGTIDFRIKPFQEQNQSLTIHANGTCVYKNEGHPGNLHDPKGLPAKTYEHTLGKDQVARLEAILKKTMWLTHPGAVSSAMHTHPTTVTITLLRAGETRKVVCQGRQPDPYHALIWFSRCLSRQEKNLYLLQWGNDDARLHVCRDLAGEIDGLRGEPGRMHPIFEIDYRRYVREFRRPVDNPEAYRDKSGSQLMAAIKVLSYIGDEESFGKIAQLALDRNYYVRRAAVDAIAHMGRPDHVPFLLKAAKMDSTSQDAAWAMIRMGDMAVPAIAGVLEANDTGLAYNLVRQYINHWDELPGPLDERVLQAVRAGMPKRGDPRDAYYGDVIDLARERPIEPVPMLGLLDYADLVRHKSSRFIHGWYTVVDGRIDRHAAAPRTDTSTDHLCLTVFKPEVQGGTLRYAAGWTAQRWKHGRKPVPVQETFEMPVPEGSLLETDHVYYKRKLPTGSGGNAVRITKDYQVLWQGRVVSNGKTFLTLVYIGRLAEAAEKEQRFVLPRQPLTYKRTPEFRRWPFRARSP